MKESTIIKRLRKIRSDLRKDSFKLCDRKHKESCNGDSCTYCVINEAKSNITKLLNNIAGIRNESPEVSNHRRWAKMTVLICASGIKIK